MIQKEFFGKVAGQDVYSYTLTNRGGLSAELLSLGGILNSFLVPTGSGTIDIALGHQSVEDFFSEGALLGGIVGRNANRIKNATFALSGRKIQLEQNDGSHNLHSGSGSYQKKIFTVEEVGKTSLCLKHLDLGEGGFSGTVTVAVTVTLNDQNQLVLEYTATPSEDTIINLTHHAYFNLSGHLSGSLEDHTFQIFADHYTPVKPDGIPTGEIRPVEGTVFDFTRPRGLDLEQALIQAEVASRRGYDHNFCLKGGREFKDAAAVVSQTTGIKLICSTDQPGLQLYTGNFIAESTPGKGGVYGPRSGFCLETQNFPDAVNNQSFPSPVVRKGEVYRTKTVYEVSLIS